jgi:hypothetical protein
VKSRYLSALALFALAILSSCSSYEAAEDLFPSDTAATTVTETVGDWLTVRPAEGTVREGILFYPGGLVEPEAYLPLARTVVEKTGALAVIVPMPFDLAVFSPQRGTEVPPAFPSVKTWFAAGHSLGGAMVASLVEKNRNLFSGLVLLAAYPSKANDLSGTDIPVLSLTGEHDGLVTAAKIEAAKPLLPADTEYVTIAGGNHAWFGNYGTQEGDGEATIGHEEQWDITAEWIARLVLSVSHPFASSLPSS